MVAYSYKKRFAIPLAIGLGLDLNPDELPWLRGLPIAAGMPIKPKRQTIRADRKRHARSGEEIQHYCGMRTKGCFLIGLARCTRIRAIVLTLEKRGHVAIGGLTHITDKGSYVEPETHYSGSALDTFAQMDGFADWNEMLSFWDVTLFIGQLIEWEPL